MIAIISTPFPPDISGFPQGGRRLQRGIRFPRGGNKKGGQQNLKANYLILRL